MRVNTEPVNEMLAELKFLKDETKLIIHSINHTISDPLMDQLARNMLLVKFDEIYTLNWLLEEEYVNGIHINEIIDREGLQNIQRK